MKMRFVIKQAGNSGERIGALSGFARTDGVIDTPTAALYTRGASVAHLTADVLTRIFTSPHLLWIPLSNSLQLETGVKFQGEGVAKFSGLNDHISCSTLHDITEEVPIGHFEKDSVPLWTRNGKKMITADRYMDIMEVFKPDILLAIADGRIVLDEGIKRTIKSVDRTCKMLDTCVKRYSASSHLQNTALIGVLVGGTQTKERQKCLEHLLSHKDVYSGIALAGLTDGAVHSHKITPEQIEPTLEDVGKQLPSDLVHILEGCWNPAVIVAAIEKGWDVFDGSYPAKLTNLGYALVLKFDNTAVSDDELCILDMNDQRYKDEFKPILEDCQCLACKKHTRAYINHLLVTKELLASVLLSIHNLHHFEQMFQEARNHIAAKTFHNFKILITEQYNTFKSKRVDIAETDDISNPQKNNNKKKKKRLLECSNSDNVENIYK